MGKDILDLLGRNLSECCPHRLKDWQKCTVCDAIFFDRPLDTIGDMPWDELIISSPRMKQPDLAELPDLIKRLTGENAILELDISSNKIKSQSEYVNAHLLQVSKSHASGSSEQCAIEVRFSPNLQGDRESLFPKLPCRGEQRASKPDIQSGKVDQEPKPAYQQSPLPFRITIYLPPYTGEGIVVKLARAAVAGDLVLQIVKDEDLDEGKKWSLRWTEDGEGCPDYDLPAIADDQVVMDLNTKELCLSEG